MTVRPTTIMRRCVYCVSFIVLYSILTPLSAQYLPVLEEGKKWTIEHNQGMGSVTYYDYTLLCDTVIAGRTYLQYSEDTYLGEPLGFIREDTVAREVYYLPQGSKEEYLLMSFNLQEGDSLPNSDYVVQAVRYDTLWDGYRKVIELDEFLWLIEGIGGSSNGVLPVLIQFPPWSVLQAIELTGQSCDSTTSNIVIEAPDDLRVYPNPFQELLRIESDSMEKQDYLMFNSLGGLITQGTIVQQIDLDLSSLPSGIYFLRVGGSVVKLLKN